MHPAGYASVLTASLSLEPPAVPHNTRRRCRFCKGALLQRLAKPRMLQAPRKGLTSDVRHLYPAAGARMPVYTRQGMRRKQYVKESREQGGIPAASCITLYPRIAVRIRCQPDFSRTCRIPPVSPASHPG